MTLVINSIGGNCPVQAWGTVCGKEFYFRARGECWSMGIGGDDIVLEPEWIRYGEYGDGPYAAGWMPEDEAREIIEKCAAEYAAGAPSQTGEDDDGQPSEAQEWHDYDPEC